MSEKLRLYIHIPFCKSKCAYCDFFSGKADEKAYDEYVMQLKDKIEYWSKRTDKTLSSVYFGGGTPSVLGDNRLCEVLEFIKQKFSVDNNAEITVEVNPESGKSLDFEKLYKCGFNRISVGMQSSDEKELKLLGRIHSTDDVRQTIYNAKNAGISNISLDLMLGIPCQTERSLKKSIDFCAELGVTHISSYILKIEEGTPFYINRNKYDFADDDKQAELYLYAVDYLNRFGYKQYEISNFAKSGFESKHNTGYWKLDEYIGIGPSAHSFFEGKRFFYERDMQSFNDNVITADGTGGDEEEFIMLSLRLAQGLDFDEYKKRFGREIPESLIKSADKYIKAGLMKKSENSIAFTPKGFLVSNAIISELI